MMTPEMQCDAFDALLPDYLERTLDAANLAAARMHLATCERCAALVRDLDDIRARAAGGLWSGGRRCGRGGLVGRRRGGGSGFLVFTPCWGSRFVGRLYFCG